MSGGTFVARLRQIVGPSHVLTDPDLRASYENDWTGRFRGTARAVVRPGSTEEVAAIVRLCNGASVPIVPQGGNTGLVGGGVPRGGEVVLSLRRLDSIGAIDELTQEVTVGAGVTLGALQESARTHGLTLGVDLASRGTATIGGMVATNAGGLYALRHGPMRRQLVGIEAVLASGEIVRRLPGLAKDNSGYSLADLLAGSEGTLAIITGVRLRLVPIPAWRAVALLGFARFEDVIQAVGRLRHEVDSLLALEGFFADGLAVVSQHAGLPPPFEAGDDAFLLVECGGSSDPLPALAAAVEGRSLARHTAVASDRPGREALWAYRELHTEAINARGVPHKLDVALPLGRLVEFRARVIQLLGQFPGALPILFGHVGDGNLHVNVLGLGPNDDSPDRAVFALVAEMGGSISAEHGIGVAKADSLHLTRTAADLRWMTSVKRALDPQGILNPGVLFGPSDLGEA